MKLRAVYSGLLSFLLGMGIVGACATGTTEFEEGDDGELGGLGGLGGTGGVPNPQQGQGGMSTSQGQGGMGTTAANSNSAAQSSSVNASSINSSGFSSSFASSGTGGLICMTTADCTMVDPTTCCVGIPMVGGFCIDQTQAMGACLP